MISNLLILTMLLIVTWGLVGYDCGEGSLNITTISLLDPLECDILETEPQIETTYVHLLQLSEFKQTSVVQRGFKIDRTVYYYGT